MRRISRLVVVVAASGAAASLASAAIFNGGNLVVLEAQGTFASGTSGSINSLASSVSLREWVPGSGFSGNLTALNSSSTGTRLTVAGSSTSEGQLTISSNGQYLLCAGYDAAFGTSGPTAGSSIATSTTANVNRVIGQVDLNGTATYNRITDAYSTNNFRAAASTTGSSFYTVASNGGLRLNTPPATTTTLLNTAAGSSTNIRAVNLFDFGSGPEVYVSSAAGSLFGVGKLNTGTGAIDILPGFPTTTGPSSEDFTFLSSTTLYVCDDRSAASAGGLQRWDLGGTGTWALTYTLSAGLPSTASGLRSITLGANGQIFAIAGGSAAGGTTSLVFITDTGVGSTFTTLATSSAGTVFRGVEWIVPAPGAATLLGLGGLLAARRRR